MSASAETNESSTRYPGWPGRIVIVLTLLTAVVVQALGQFDDPPFPFDDPAVRNLVTIGALFGTALAVWVWFCFRSNLPRTWRKTVLAATAVALVMLVGATVAVGFAGVLQFMGNLTVRLDVRENKPAPRVSETAFRRADWSVTTPADFPQFLGPNRNGWIAGPRLARDWKSSPPRQIWKQAIGAGWSSFAASNGYAVTLEQHGDEERVVCYEIETGQAIWNHVITTRHESVLGGVGPRSTPTIHAGRVYALGATGVLRCLNDRGELLWSDDLRRRYGVTAEGDEQQVMFGRAASPLIVNSQVIVPGGGSPGNAKNLVAFDGQTGRLKWEAESQIPNAGADQISYASPTLATLAGRPQVLIVNESTASGHDPSTGERLWFHPWPGRSNGNANVSQSVAVGSNQVLLTKGYGGGAELIELSVPAMGIERDILTVQSLWKVPRSLQTKFSNVVLHQGHAFALSEGILECVSLADGQRRWKRGRYGHGQILGVGELLLVLSEEGELHLLELNPESFVHLGTHQVLQGKTWNTLCLHGKRLLVRNATQAACLELP
jgi:outer membrane protein assembly factor BamB